MTLDGHEAPIAVICALEVECRALAGLARPGVEIHVSGMGADAARSTAERVVARRPRALLAVGFCGALSPALRAGDLVVADVVVHENTGEAFPADTVMAAAAPGRHGTLVTAMAVARTPADRAALEGIAVDLESAAVARAARDADVPFLALRAVSDRAKDRIPDIVPMLDDLGRPDRRRLAAWALRHPREVPRLARLGRGSRRAGRALAEGVDTLLRRLGA